MTETPDKNERFLDTGTRIYDFYEEFPVVCPKCARLAKVVIDDAEFARLPTRKLLKFRNQFFAPRRLICLNCPHRDTWKGSRILTGANVDWYFRLHLWLEISCCGTTLWAYNQKHLEMLESYVSAKLRERTVKGRSSVLSKLPKWIKSAKNRDEILRAIAKLRGKLNGKS
ncbi:MAG TPA: hypothetical protein VGC97_04640 [Pyrinomonadaceae bacterium]|jgi:hypothetical protein